MQARLSSTDPNAGALMPIVASMDIAAAFPSLIRQWFWAVLERWGIQGNFATILMCCYTNPLCFLTIGGVRRPLLNAESGVAQGCPLSGTIWAPVFDPFIRGISAELRQLRRGLISACADDL
eukprot:9262621-Pyramimonas_sp.AAC.1